MVNVGNKRSIYICIILLLFSISMVFIYKGKNNMYKLPSEKPPNPINTTNISSNENLESKSNNDIKKNTNDTNINKKASSSKAVYLTFDDGPSINNTKRIIKILNENNVKATFFVTGNSVVRYPEIVEELHKNKMAIAPHTFTHDYKLIYSSAQSYVNDLEKCIETIEKFTKGKVIPFTRIPGGIKNKRISPQMLNEIKQELKKRNIYYVEWNICSDDSISKKISSTEIKNNVINQTNRLGKNKILIVLMHDSYYKQTTVDALPSIIKFYKNLGWEFKTLNDVTGDDIKEIIKFNLINTEYREK